MRIASLLPGATEILYALGLGPQVVAISHDCDYPHHIDAVPRATRTEVDSAQSSKAIDCQVRAQAVAGTGLYQLDVELLVDLEPDVIVTQQQCDVCSVKLADVQHLVSSHDALRETTIVATGAFTLAGLFADIHRIGEACNCGDEADRLTRELQQRIEAVRSAVARLRLPRRPRVATIEWLEPLMLAAHWTPSLIEIAGGQSGVALDGQPSVYTGWDELVEFDPEVILIAPCGFSIERTEQELKSWSRLERWRSLPAVSSGRVFLMDGNAYLNRAGPRLIDSLELIAHLMHDAIAVRLPDGVMEGRAWRRLGAIQG